MARYKITLDAEGGLTDEAMQILDRIVTHGEDIIMDFEPALDDDV